MPRLVSIPADELDGLRSRLREAEDELDEWRRLGADSAAEIRSAMDHDRRAVQRQLVRDAITEAAPQTETELVDRWAQALAAPTPAAAALVVLISSAGAFLTPTWLATRARSSQRFRRGEIEQPVNLAANMISRLRTALRPHSLDQLVETGRGRGYRITKHHATVLGDWLAAQPIPE